MALASAVQQNVARLRRSKKMTQGELASLAGICVSYVSMLERGERVPTLDTVEALAGAFRVPALSLFKVRG